MAELSREHQLLGHLLQHPAWDGLMKPVIQERVKLYYAQLVDPSRARKDMLPDDFLRGAIDALRWVIEYPEKEMDTAYAEMQAEEKAAKEVAEEVPLFGGGRPDSENGDGHGRPEVSAGTS